MRRDYFPDIDAASRVRSYDEARLLMIRVARAYHFEHVAMFTCATDGVTYGFDNYDPSSWSRFRMTTLHEQLDDPTLQHVRAGRSVALWDTTPVRNVIGGRLTPQLTSILGNAHEDGIKAGITVPFAREGRIAYINFTSTSASDVRDLQQHAPELALIANVLHGQLASLELPESPTEIKLSRREREALLLRRDARMTVPQIADLWGVSVETVQENIKRAARKLGCSRRILLSEATRRGLL